MEKRKRTFVRSGAQLSKYFLVLSMVACMFFLISSFAMYLDHGYMSSVTSPDADSLGIGLFGAIIATGFSAFMAYVIYLCLKKHRDKKIDGLLLFRRMPRVSLSVFRWIVLVACLAFLYLCFVPFATINILSDSSWIICSLSGVLAVMLFFTVIIGSKLKI